VFFVYRAADAVFVVIAMSPLSDAESCSLHRKTRSPIRTCFLGTFPDIGLLLYALPVFGQKAFEKVLPTNGGLVLYCLTNMCRKALNVDNTLFVPAIEAMENCSLETCTRFFFLEVGADAPKGFFEPTMGTLCLTLQDVGRGLCMESKARALCMILEFPFH
jgi:hypothetical protein